MGAHHLVRESAGLLPRDESEAGGSPQVRTAPKTARHGNVALAALMAGRLCVARGVLATKPLAW